MTYNRYRLPIILVIQGPVLTAGHSFASWGLNVVFYRNHKGELTLPGRHIRGKLREALRDLASVNSDLISKKDIKTLLGLESGKDPETDDAYAPVRGTLKIHDFIENRRQFESKTIQRIRIDNQRGSVESGGLFMFEAPFAAGEETRWKGGVEFFADESQKDSIADVIKKGVCFITAVGAEKTVGFGRVKRAVFGSLDEVEIQNEDCSFKGHDTKIVKVAVQPREPFVVGKGKPADNVFVSESVIPGSVIKGSFAAGLNRLKGLPLATQINEDNAIHDYPLLFKHFTALRFLHAKPAFKAFQRPRTIPLSGVSYGDEYEDIAFIKEEDVYARGDIPITFQIDWKKKPKNLPEKYRTPDIQLHSATFTAINPDNRRADDGKLYTFQMVKPTVSCPDNGGESPVYWNTEIVFPKGMQKEERKQLTDEIRKVLPRALCYIGKKQSAVDLFMDTDPVINDGETGQQGNSFAVVLQTPALMIDPELVSSKTQGPFGNDVDLRALYHTFWRGLLDDKTIELERFFAVQELLGGYQGMRFRKHGYSPFYLTSAGSVFVIRSGNSAVLEKAREYEHTGLPFPEWADKENNKNQPAWQINPYVPENGYGEIQLIIKEQ